LVETVMLLTGILNVSGSSLDWDTYYLHVLLILSLPSRKILKGAFELEYDRYLSCTFQLIAIITQSLDAV
jgi:hypothetical protein